MKMENSIKTTIKSSSNNQNNTNIINLLNQQHDLIKKKSPLIPIEILDDLSSRFIINLPIEERGDIIRLLFQIEIAHWFYVDFHVIEKPDLVKYSFKPFAKIMFSHVPFLRKYLDKFDEVIDKWRDYKHSVPTYGAVILDEAMENVLMVQGFWSNSTWGFPKGKVNAEEDPVVCACREVKEEIGFDCTSLIESTEFIEIHIRETYIRLYIIAGVNRNENFHPLTRNEIKKIQWFPIKDLPTSRHEKELNPNAFFMAIPIIKSLKRWIYERRTLNSDYNKYFNKNFQASKNYYASSPVSNKYSKENNHYLHSTNKNSTQQQNNANGNNFNRRQDKLFKKDDKITILKNSNHGNRRVGNTKFFSESLMNFNLNFDALWKECIISS